MTSLATLKNICKKTERLLQSVGIYTIDDLAHTGSKKAFVWLKMRDPQVNLEHLLALEGALQNVDKQNLPENVRKNLQEYSDSFR